MSMIDKENGRTCDRDPSLFLPHRVCDLYFAQRKECGWHNCPGDFGSGRSFARCKGTKNSFSDDVSVKILVL